MNSAEHESEKELKLIVHFLADAVGEVGGRESTPLTKEDLQLLRRLVAEKCSKEEKALAIQLLAKNNSALEHLVKLMDSPTSAESSTS